MWSVDIQSTRAHKKAKKKFDWLKAEHNPTDLLKFIFTLNYMHMSVCGYMHTTAGSHRVQGCNCPGSWSYRWL